MQLGQSRFDSKPSRCINKKLNIIIRKSQTYLFVLTSQKLVNGRNVFTVYLRLLQDKYLHILKVEIMLVYLDYMDRVTRRSNKSSLHSEHLQKIGLLSEGQRLVLDTIWYFRLNENWKRTKSNTGHQSHTRLQESTTSNYVGWDISHKGS